MERNYWGIDVTVYTPRATKPEDEKGLCTYEEDKHGDFTKFGEKLKWVFVNYGLLKWNKCFI